MREREVITREDVARRARVSTAVVSYVLNDGPRPVAPETRARVLHAVEQLGYRPNQVARSLRSRRSHSLGLLVPEAANPFYAEVARGIEDECYARGYTLTVGNTNESSERRTAYAANLVGRQVDALFFDSTGVSAAELDLLDRTGTLGVYIGTADELDDELRSRIACVTMDTYRGGQAVGRLFVESGHRRFGCIAGGYPVPPFERRPWPRVEGFLAALRDAGFDAPVLWAGSTPADGYRAAGDLLTAADPPTAIFAGNDFIAMGVLRRAADLGLRVPHDVAVCGFDDIELASYVQPRLTTVRVPKAAMGQRRPGSSLDALRRDPAEREALVPTHHDLEVELITREST